MTLDPTRAPISGTLYSTESFRLAIQGLLGGATGTFAGGLASDAGHGVVRALDMLVAQNGTPNMSVNVAAGGCFVRGSESALQGSYPAYSDGTVNAPIAAADGTNPRKDIVGVQVLDSNYGGSDPADNGVFIVVVTGTPASSPSDPTVPDNFLPLARVTVSASDTSITTGEITDLRQKARPWNSVWGELIRTELATSFTQTSSLDFDITGMGVTGVLLADRKSIIEMFIPAVHATPGVATAVNLYEGLSLLQSGTLEDAESPVLLRTKPTAFSAGSHTFKGAVHVNGGSGSMIARARGGTPYIAIIDAGPV